MVTLQDLQRRPIIKAAAALGSAGVMGPVGAQGKEFKIGLFIALSGPAALFGPTQRACADLAAEELNKALKAGKWTTGSGYGKLKATNVRIGHMGDVDVLSVENYLCLLYTSDAADDLLCVDLGGRRLIKKKNTQ